MIVRREGVAHRAALVCEYDEEAGEQAACCQPDTPCSAHFKQLTWTIVTWCELVMSIKGRNKGGLVTCLTCLARAA